MIGGSIAKRAVVVLSLLTLCGCAGKSPTTQKATPAAGLASGFPITLTDAQGDRLTLAARPRRIVSLAPAVTEILFSLGQGDAVLMDTLSCDFPPEARRKPHVDPLSGSVESLQIQRPDLVIGQARLEDRMLGLCRKAGLPTLAIDARNFAQTYDAIRLIGRAVGAANRSDTLANQLQERIEGVRRTMSSVKQRPRVLMMYSTNPIYTTGPGSFIDEAITTAGGKNVVDQPLQGDVITSEQVLVRQPEVIVCSKETEASARQSPGWVSSVPAVRANRFFHPDEALERPCPRLAGAVGRLARFLHPEIKQP